MMFYITLLVVICADPTPVNGRTRPAPLSKGLYSFGTNVTFSCNDGFTISGNLSSNCQANDTWSHQPPVCNPGKEINCRNSSSAQPTVFDGKRKLFQ